MLAEADYYATGQPLKLKVTIPLGALDEALFTFEWRHPDPRMDELHRRVSILVEEAEARGEDPRLSFYRIKSLALSLDRSGELAALSPREPAAVSSADPKLSEPWFC